jgi:hypothetical protein
MADGASMRTGALSAARIALEDGSAVEIAAATEISLERIALVPTNKRYLSLLHLREGKVHVLVGEQYGLEGSRFEVETPTAVAGARGGGEVLVLHDRDDEMTTVVGLEGDVAVQGTIGLIGPGATVGPKSSTRVRRGRFPASPEPVDPQTLTVYREGLAVLGTGDPNEGIGAGHPALNGRILRPEDLATKVAAEVPGTAPALPPTLPDAALSRDSLAESLSPDVRIHTQPIPEYRAARPGDRPIGGVQVDF